MTSNDWLSLLACTMIGLSPFIIYSLLYSFLYIRKYFALLVAWIWYPAIYKEYKLKRMMNNE